MRSWGILTAALAGCYNPTFSTGAPCQAHYECPGNLQCIQGRCGGTERNDAAIDVAPLIDGTIDSVPDTLNLVDVVVGDDAAELRDGYLWGANPNINYATLNHFGVDDAESGVLWFDLSEIETTRTITSATLSVVTLDAADEAGGTVTIHRLRESWVEAEVTFLARMTGASWSTAGALSPASDTAPLATFSPAAINTTYDIELPVGLVQDWVDTPAINFGLLFSRGSSAEHVHISTRESTAWSRLTVTYY